MSKFYILEHYAISPRYYRGENLEHVHGACGRFVKVKPEEVPLPAWPGSSLLDVVYINEEEAWDLIAS